MREPEPTKLSFADFNINHRLDSTADEYVAELMTALDAEEIPSEQDWEAETTTWTLADCTIAIRGDEITVTRTEQA